MLFTLVIDYCMGFKTSLSGSQNVTSCLLWASATHRTNFQRFGNFISTFRNLRNTLRGEGVASLLQNVKEGEGV